MRDSLVLSPTHRGDVGVAALNEALSLQLNPRGQEIGKHCAVRVGDRAVFTEKNLKDIGLINGTRLVIEAYDRGAGEVIATDDAENRVLKVPKDKARYLQPAYAMSVHRAQGQEAPVAVTVYHRQLHTRTGKPTFPRLLANENFYTSITRARQVSVVTGERDAIAAAIANRGATGRWTGLPGRASAGDPALETLQPATPSRAGQRRCTRALCAMCGSVSLWEAGCAQNGRSGSGCMKPGYPESLFC